MAVVAEGNRVRVYLTAMAEHEEIARSADQDPVVADACATFLSPATPTRAMITGGVCSAYGLRTWGHLFTPRQLVALTTFSDLVGEARERVLRDARAAGLLDDAAPLREGGTGATAYADAVATYLGEAASKLAAYHSALGVWRAKEQKTGRAFGRQAIPMVWDFPECNPFAGAGGDWKGAVNDAAGVLESLGYWGQGSIWQQAAQEVADNDLLSVAIDTDPPYYDNVGYADLADFFMSGLGNHSVTCGQISSGA
jgi:putative DNA methylase